MSSPSPYPAYGGQSPSDGGRYRYPPVNGPYGNLPSSSAVHLSTPHKDAYASSPQIRGGLRTPSPTPSEAEELSRTSALDWNKLKNWRFWFRREWLWYYVAIVIITVVVSLVTIYHHQIVTWLTPAATFLKGLPGGWAIPIAILFVISFPPLFGHEIIAVLCGVVWGLWIGFAIVAAGTFIGEVGNFYAFKWCCRARGEKLEKTNITYGVLARVVREGGFKIALIARLSAIPGHFTTAVFSSCGMGIIVFSIAAILSLPKQFVTVYLGVLIDGSGTESTGQRISSYAVVAVTFIITALAMWYIFRQMARAKPAFIYERRKARQARLALGAHADMSTSSFSQSNVTLTAPGVISGSTSDIALHAYSPSEAGFQQWDAQGRAVGHTDDPRLYAPQPRAASGRVPTFRTEGGGGYSGTGARYPDGDDPGVAYPTSPRADGRLPVRQNSDGEGAPAAVATSPHRVASPSGVRNPYEPSRAARNPYEPTAAARDPYDPAAAAPPFPSPGFAPAPIPAPIRQQSYAAHVPTSVSAPPPQSPGPHDLHAVYDYNPPSPAHSYANAYPSQARRSAATPVHQDGSLPMPPFAGGAPPATRPLGGASSPVDAATPERMFSPPPAYALSPR